MNPFTVGAIVAFVVLGGLHGCEVRDHAKTKANLVACELALQGAQDAVAIQNGIINGLNTRVADCEARKAIALDFANERAEIIGCATVAPAQHREGIIDDATRKKAADHINRVDW